MGLLAKLFLGDGTLKPELRAALESEGPVLLDEGLSGTVSYEHFKAPGRFFHGKKTPERVGVGVSEQRVVAYCRSGKAKLIDTSFGDPKLDALDVSLERDDKVAFRVDYSRIDVPDVSGVVTIRVKTPNAANLVEQLRARLGRPGA